jgi:hypothetical protein
MGLAKKNKNEQKQLSVNEIDETIIRKNNDVVPPPVDDQTHKETS